MDRLTEKPFRIDSEYCYEQALDESDCKFYRFVSEVEDFLEELGFESLEGLKNALLIKIPEIEDCEEVSITKVDNKDKFSPASKEDIYKAIAKDLDKRILKDISKVFERYGIELDEDRFMQVVKEYQLKVEN